MAYLLIVDDDEDFATAAATVLGADGHEVAIVLETGKAVQSMTDRRPDLLILDVMFPENSSAGFEFARSLHKSNRQFEDVPVLMLTAVNAKFPLGFSRDDIDEAWMPVTDFIEKPVDFGALRGKVSQILSS